MNSEDAVIRKLVSFGNREDSCRALILTSTRADSSLHCDILSDYDVVVFTTDTGRFLRNDDWFESFGPTIVVFRDDGPHEGLEWHSRLVLYEDGTRIDFSIEPIENLHAIYSMPVLPDEYDLGYRVLLDKDGGTVGLKQPTHQAFVPDIPTEDCCASLVNNFWWNTVDVAKLLWRDDLFAARWRLETGSVDLLRQMLEWSVEIDCGWRWKPGNYGKGLVKKLDNAIRREFLDIYAGASLDESWESLFRTTALFRKVAGRVSESLGYSYPHELDRRVSVYLETLRKLDKNADCGELTRLLQDGLHSGGAPSKETERA